MSLTIAGKLSLPTGQPAANALVRFRAVNSVGEIIQGAESTARCDASGNYSITIEFCKYELSTKISTTDFIVHGILEISSETVATDLEDLIALISLTEIAESGASTEIIKKMQELKVAAEQAASESEASALASQGYRDESLAIKTSVEATAAQVTADAAQVSADAAQVSSDKANVQINKDIVNDDKLIVEGYKTDVESLKAETLAFRDEASTFATNAESSATQAAASQASALDSAIRAEAAAQTASSGIIDRGKWDASTGLFPTPNLDPETTDWYRISVGGTMVGTGSQTDVTVVEGDNLYWDRTDDVWYKIGNPNLNDITPESIGAAPAIHTHNMADIEDADSYLGARYVKLSSGSQQTINSGITVTGRSTFNAPLQLGARQISTSFPEGSVVYDNVFNDIAYLSVDPSTGYKSWKKLSYSDINRITETTVGMLLGVGSSSVDSSYNRMWINTSEITTDRVFTVYPPYVVGNQNHFAGFGDVSGTCSKLHPIIIRPYNANCIINGKSEDYLITEPFRFVTIVKRDDNNWIVTHDTGRNDYYLPDFADGYFTAVASSTYSGILVPDQTDVKYSNILIDFDPAPVSGKNITVQTDGVYIISFNATVDVLGDTASDYAEFIIDADISTNPQGAPTAIRRTKVSGSGTHSVSMNATTRLLAGDSLSFDVVLSNSSLITGNRNTSFSLSKLV